jgi:hypothetical protein
MRTDPRILADLIQSKLDQWPPLPPSQQEELRARASDIKRSMRSGGAAAAREVA